VLIAVLHVTGKMIAQANLLDATLESQLVIG